MFRADQAVSPSRMKVNSNKKTKKHPNTESLPIHSQDENVTKMINNFIGRVERSVVINNPVETEIRVINQNNKLKSSVFMPNTKNKNTRKLTNINSVVLSTAVLKIPQIETNIEKIIDSTLPIKYEAYTVAELAKAPLFVQFEIDDRNSLTFYWHELKNGHEILNLFFYKSISTPFHIRLTILFISLSMRLCLSAMFFSDSYIKEQTDYKNKFGPEYTGWGYTFTNDILRILWPMLISVIAKNILNLFILMSKEKLLMMNKFFAGGTIRIKETM